MASTHDELYSANKAHWDKAAKDLDKHPWGMFGMKMADQMLPHLLKTATFDKGKTEVMDFACGNGYNSTLMAPNCKSILGVDISTGMVDEYNRNIERWGLDKNQLHAVRADIENTQGTELEGKTFDIIYCSMAYHHLPSMAETTKNLATYLKPGGKLLVVDWIRPETEPHIPAEVLKYMNQIMKVPGIDEEEMKEVFERGGLRFRSYDKLLHMNEVVGGVEVNNWVFLACAEK